MWLTAIANLSKPWTMVLIRRFLKYGRITKLAIQKIKLVQLSRLMHEKKGQDILLQPCNS
jgi:hypothetical protein